MTEIRSFRGENFFLSNFYESEFHLPGLDTAASGEHAYNALKTNRGELRRMILEAAAPREAKALGRSVPLRADWNVGGRVSEMFDVIRAKFSGDEMAGKLLATGDTVLIEGNTHHDNFWGDCECGGAACQSPGVNMLGEILMAVRSELAADGSPITEYLPQGPSD